MPDVKVEPDAVWKDDDEWAEWSLSGLQGDIV
jgi:hypothetical protein